MFNLFNFSAQSPSIRRMKQGGFTLLELLFTVVLMVGVIVVVQRYIAGVVVDQASISSRQDQSSQVQIVLSNLKQDVAQAGSYPFATKNGVLLFPIAQTGRLGVKTSPCTLNNCVGDQLDVVSVVPVASARDCHGNSIQYTIENGLLNSGWVFVRNQYAFRKDGSLLRLDCLGNGGLAGWRGILSGITSAQFSQTNIGGVVRLISLCLITLDNSGMNDGSATLTDCAGANLPAAGAGYQFYKTRIEMPVNNYSFTAS